MVEYKFLKSEYSKRYDNDLAHCHGEEEFAPLEYADDLKW